MGKSYFILALIAAFSRGQLPDGKPLEGGPINSLILASEDDADDAIVPRLKSFNCDLSRVMHDSTLYAFDDAGLERLEASIVACNAEFVLIDPIIAYVGSAVNINAANEVRPLFTALRGIALRHNCVFVNVRHHGKSIEGKAIKHLGLGSVDIRAVHRSQLSVQKHPNVPGLRVVTHEKHNYSEEGPPIGYDFKFQGQFSFVWNVPEWREGSPGQVYKMSELDKAKAFLAEVITGQWRRRSDVLSLAKESGISERQIERAMSQLKESKALLSQRLNGPNTEASWMMPSKTADGYDPIGDY